MSSGGIWQFKVGLKDFWQIATHFFPASDDLSLQLANSLIGPKISVAVSRKIIEDFINQPLKIRQPRWAGYASAAEKHDATVFMQLQQVAGNVRAVFYKLHPAYTRYTFIRELYTIVCNPYFRFLRTSRHFLANSSFVGV